MTDKPTGVFVRLPLSDEQEEQFDTFYGLGGGLEKAVSCLGTPVTGGELEVVGYITDNRPFDTNTLTHWILYKHRQHDREYGVVLQSDALAQIAARDAEITRLREALVQQKTFHESEDKSLSKQPPSSQGAWRRNQHQEQIELIDEALKGGAA
ncbi:hypothetical protein [Acetobacter orientalis]|uniref:Uncharacterized protein n=1 Tax=Acetobacter orientalis TaxID=146474 RepID=A0A0D6NLA8_9PROT|nr:hypothetical protein [Acetobacter orientalis]GAN66867.1 hypothetical protein Abor_031_033 [Acetobacter orientalis]GBR14412.1 hypothetical protein AA0481_0606 [Acetobacter orientalis NRIC 0481]GEL60888.1 hypothetical protein AOR02nite_07300 [Acetobacter orientalis]